MVVNLIMLAVTLMMVAFLIVWVCFPRLRPWIEAPKYRVLTWEERFPQAVRPPVDDEC
jgi:hypothetical protein